MKRHRCIFSLLYDWIRIKNLIVLSRHITSRQNGIFGSVFSSFCFFSSFWVAFLGHPIAFGDSRIDNITKYIYIHIHRYQVDLPDFQAMSINMSSFPRTKVKLCQNEINKKQIFFFVSTLKQIPWLWLDFRPIIRPIYSS